MKSHSAARPFLLALILTACSGLDRQRVLTERATYDWIAPLTINYIQADVKLDVSAKTIHLRALDAWNQRILADEIAIGIKTEGSK